MEHSTRPSPFNGILTVALPRGVADPRAASAAVRHLGLSASRGAVKRLTAIPSTKPKWPVRAGLAFCVAVYCVYSSFGIAAPFWWGHHGYHGATYMLRARMSLRLHMLSPATWAGFEAPPLAALYFHHPIGYHHLLTLLMPIFGDHEWLARGVAAAGGLVALWALYALVRTLLVARGRPGRRRRLRRPAGADLVQRALRSDAPGHGLRARGRCGAYLSLLEQPDARARLWHAFFAYALGGLIMWEAYFIGPFIAVHALFYSLDPARPHAACRHADRPLQRAVRAHARSSAPPASLMMAFHIWFTQHAGVWEDFLDSYRIRHSPPSAQYVIDRTGSGSTSSTAARRWSSAPSGSSSGWRASPSAARAAATSRRSRSSTSTRSTSTCSPKARRCTCTACSSTRASSRSRPPTSRSDAYGAAHRPALAARAAGVAAGRHRRRARRRLLRRRGAARLSQPHREPRPHGHARRGALRSRAAEAALRRRSARAHHARRARHHPLSAPRRAQGVLVLHRSQLRRDPVAARARPPQDAPSASRC